MKHLPVCLALLALAGTARPDDKPAAPGTKFKGTAEIPKAVQIATGFSEDKQAVSVLFRNNQAAVGTGRGSLVATRVTTVSLPFDTSDKEVKLTQDVRGFVSVQGKARAVLIVQAAGKTTVVDLKAAEVKDKEEPPAGAIKQAKDSAKTAAKDFPAPNKGNKAYDFHARIDGTVAAKASYQVTFVLLVERDSDADGAGAVLTIDSFDVELKSK